MSVWMVAVVKAKIRHYLEIPKNSICGGKVHLERLYMS